MRYLGNKTKLSTPLLNEVLRQSPNPRHILDAFGGSGGAGRELKRLGAQVDSNDFLYFSTCLLSATVAVNKVPEFAVLTKDLGCSPFEYLNGNSASLLNFAQSRTVVQERYSAVAGRQYFTNQNALRIDACRAAIESFHTQGSCSDEEHGFLLGCLVSAASHVANTTGTFGAFLKTWDKRAHKCLSLEIPELVDNGFVNTASNMDVLDFVRGRHADVAYFDPPYNQRQYLGNYHVLEAIACWSTPNSTRLSGVYSDVTKKSEFCSKRLADKALQQLLGVCSADAVVLSYSSEGLISIDRIEADLKAWGNPSTFHLTRIEHPRYQNSTARDSAVTELIFSIRRGTR